MYIRYKTAIDSTYTSSSHCPPFSLVHDTSSVLDILSIEKEVDGDKYNIIKIPVIYKIPLLINAKKC